MPPIDNTPWSHFLPPTLQLSDLYWVIGMCFFARACCAAIPDQWRKDWLISLITVVVGQVAAGILIATSARSEVYASGTGLIAAGLNILFYNLALSALEQWVRTKFGTPKITDDAVTEIPFRHFPPASSTTPPTIENKNTP